MQHRYRVMRFGRCNYSAQIGIEGDWILIKSCITRWGAILACKTEARSKVQVACAVNTGSTVWEAWLH